MPGWFSAVVAILAAAARFFGLMKDREEREIGRADQRAEQIEQNAETQRRIDAVPTPDDDDVLARLKDGSA